ncbi:MAG: 2Fe-2S iron-sulfur cluster binding domain-containing protein [Spirochaetes bacterium]|nr:2Fe-2S iron-sulfur cluster binding domain-containing protein [Spirochaetota bacterium]
MKTEILQQLDGYGDVIKEIEVLRKYGYDYSIDRGTIRQYIDRLHPASLDLKIVDIIEETPSARTLRLASGGYLPPFQAGQYIALTLDIGGVRTGRAYSISSPPNQTGYYDITVRRVEEGYVSSYLLEEASPGQRIVTSGPSGNFFFHPILHDRTMVLIAGGSGITPFMSMIREIVQCGIDREVYLFYGNRSDDDVIFHDELTEISSTFSNIHYIPVIEKPSRNYKGLAGYITADVLTKELRELSGKTYYLCGPPAMYDFCLPQIEGLGIPKKKIRREMYGTPKGISAHPGWPSGVKEDAVVTVLLQGGRTITASSGEPLLNSLERNGVIVPFLCRSGECSMCRVKLLSGKVFQPEGVLLRKSDREYGYIHSCAAYPLEDLEILI